MKPTYEELEAKIAELEKSVSTLEVNEQNIIKEEKRFRTIFEESPIAFFIVELDKFKIIDCNRAAEILLRGSKNQILDLTPGQLSPEYQPNFRLSIEFAEEKLNETIKNSETRFEWIHKRLDNTEFWVDVSCKLIDYDNRKVILNTWKDITDWKSLNFELKETETKLNAIIENSIDAIGIHSNGIMKMCNPAVLRLFQLESEDEILGQPLFNLIYEPERSKILEYVSKRKNLTSAPVYYLTKGVKKDGTPFDMEVSTSEFIINNENNVFVILRDISERLFFEKALKESEEKYRKIFENIHDIYFQVDLNGIFIELSPSVEKNLGYSRDFLIGNSTKNLYNNMEVRNELLDKLLKFGSVTDYEVYLTRKDEQQGYFSINAHILKDDSGIEIGVEGTIRDISYRKKAEEILLASEKRFRALVENSYDAIILLNENGIVKYRTPSATRIIGRNDEASIGKSVFEFMHPDDIDLFKNSINTILQNPGKSQIVLFRNLNENNKWIYLDCVITNMLNESSICAIVANLQNVTDKVEKDNEIKNQLAFQQALIDSIPYPVSIKNPEGIILGCNIAYERDFGTTRDYLYGKTVLDLEFLPIDIRSRFHQDNLEVIAESSQRSY